jgi:hypothetical protein
VDRTGRLVILGMFLVLAIYRLIRYFQAANARRPVPAIPASGGIAPTLSDPAARAPSAGSAAPATLLGRAATVLVWLASNLALWLILFDWPALAELPVIWRLVAGSFANFYLVRLARAAGERVSRRTAPAGPLP